MSEIKAPAQITEEARLPIGLPWGGRVYTVATLRAEKVGDMEFALDLLVRQGQAELLEGGESVQVEVPTLALASLKRLVRVVKMTTGDGSDALQGPDLTRALVGEGLHPADGMALLEADKRLGERLPGGSVSSGPTGPSASPSAGSATPAGRSDA